MRRSLTGLLSLALLALVVVHGVRLRLEDPLSSHVIGAEDPYSHIVFAKEAVENGAFGDSFHLGTAMYPPGLHALMGVLVPLGGGDWYGFTRFAPVVFGAFAIVGTYLLAARLAGRRSRDERGVEELQPNHAAGLAAALVTAVLPEHVFRTNLLFPTALDLAVLPAFLLAFVLAWDAARAEGRLVPREPHTWGLVALFLLLAAPLVFAHPWVVPLFLVPACAFVALRVLREEPRPDAALRALALPAALAVVAIAFAMAFRWDESDTGFSDFFGHLPGLSWMRTVDLPGPLLFVLLLGVLGAGAAVAVLAASRAGALRERVPYWARVALAVGLAALLLALPPWAATDLPYEVSYVDMLGRAAIGLALAGLVAALVRPTPLGDLALVLCLFLFPLTAFDLFDSPFWPQRTVAYLCVGVALLAGALVAALVDVVAARASLRRERPLLGPALTVAAFLLVAGTVAAAPAPTYKWYRLYDEEHFDAFRETVALVERDGEARVVTHGWQPALLVKALGDPASVYYSPDFFKESSERGEVLSNVHGPVYVLVDKYLLKEAAKGEFDLRFLDGKRPVLETSDGKFRLYCMEDCD